MLALPKQVKSIEIQVTPEKLEADAAGTRELGAAGGVGTGMSDDEGGQ